MFGFDGQEICDSPFTWGLRSKATGRIYNVARNRHFAEFWLVNTGAPEKFELVEHTNNGWVTRQPELNLEPEPDLVAVHRKKRMGRDEEVVRLAVLLGDPLRGVEFTSLLGARRAEGRRKK